MRSLIKKILKEETGQEHTDLEKKGIDLTIKILKKSFPFVLGHEIVREGVFQIELRIICDIEKICEFYDSDLKEYFKKYSEELLNNDQPYPFSILKMAENTESDEKWLLYKDFTDKMNEIYEYIPDELKIMSEFDKIKHLDAEHFTFR